VPERFRGCCPFGVRASIHASAGSLPAGVISS
jgi:hypothetical protein